MGKLVKKAIKLDSLIRWYLTDLEEYSSVTKRMKEYKEEILSHGEDAYAEFNIKLIDFCVFGTDNEKLNNMITNRYLSVATNNMLKIKNARYLIDYVSLLDAIKKHDKVKFANFNIDYNKFSKAVAETGDLPRNCDWIDMFGKYNEYDANYELLLNSNDPDSALYLANSLDLSTEDFKKCEGVVLAAKNPFLSTSFAQIDGANKAKHRKVVINSKDSENNGAYLISERCTKKQIEEHKQAIYTSKDKNKLKTLVHVILRKPEIFTENEINDIVKMIVKYQKIDLAKVILTSESLTFANKTKLENLISKMENKTIDTMDVKVVKKIKKQQCKNKDTLSL